MKEKTEFEKHLYKSLNKFFYGKTKEHIRRRLNFDLIHKSENHRKLKRQSKCSYDDKIVESEKFILYSFNRGSSKNTKPVYVDFFVLELPTILMYEWFYDKLQPYLEETISEILHIDTDSFTYSIKPIKGLIEDLKLFKDDFDFSDLDPSHEL